MAHYEFIISKTEIARRKSAFTTLIASMLLGFALWSLLLSFSFILENIWFSALFILTFLIVFLIFRTLIVRFFQLFLQTKVLLSDQFIERITLKSHEKHLLKDLAEISVLRTTRGDIRQVGMIFSDGHRLYLDGLDNFEEFKKQLIALSASKIKVKESSEPIDYDHPWFYAILGQLTSLVVIYTLKIITNINDSQLKFVYFVSATYIMLLGGYFIFNKPQSKRYGKKMEKADYILGALMVVASAIIYLLTLFETF